MKIGLVDFDSKITNIALMKLSTHFKNHGDTVRLTARGHPRCKTLKLNWLDDITKFDRVLGSVVFRYNKLAVEELLKQYPQVEVGGTGWDNLRKLPPEVEVCKPDWELYGEEYGVGFTYRGCVNSCEFCVVPKKEGQLVPADTLENLINPRSNRLILLNNNPTAQPDRIAFLHELSERKLRVNFNQALDIRLVNTEFAEALAKVNFTNWKGTSPQVHFAFDNTGIESMVRTGMRTLIKAGIRPYKQMYYLLAGFKSDLEDVKYRFEVIRELGADPYIMPYINVETGEKAPKEFWHFARWVNGRVYKVDSWENYEPWIKYQEERQRR